MNDELVIDENMYKCAAMLLACEDMKSKGLLAGGPEILDVETLKSIEQIGKSLGFPEPTRDDFIMLQAELNGELS